MPAYPTSGYMTAELRLNGHVITGDTENEPQKTSKFCGECEPRPLALARNVALLSEATTYIWATSLG